MPTIRGPMGAAEALVREVALGTTSEVLPLDEKYYLLHYLGRYSLG